MNEKIFSLIDILQVYEVLSQNSSPQIKLMALLKLRRLNEECKTIFNQYFCDEFGVKASVEDHNSNLILLKNGQVFGTGNHDLGVRGPKTIVPITQPVEFLGLPKISKIGIGSSTFYFKKAADNEVLCDHSTFNWIMKTKVFYPYTSSIVDKPIFSSCDEFEKKAAENSDVVEKVYEKYSDFGFFKLMKSIKAEAKSHSVNDCHIEKGEAKNSSTTDDSAAEKPSAFIP